jgi:hypothetical protein
VAALTAEDEAASEAVEVVAPGTLEVAEAVETLGAALEADAVPACRLAAVPPAASQAKAAVAAIEEAAASLVSARTRRSPASRARSGPRAGTVSLSGVAALMSLENTRGRGRGCGGAVNAL